MYTPKTFTALSVLPAADLQDLANNDASFHDGTGIDNKVIIARHLARTAIWQGDTSLASTFGTSNSSPTDIGITVTITVPTGSPARKVMLIFSSTTLENSTAGGYARATLWRGAVGGGTMLKSITAGAVSSVMAAPGTLICIDDPGPGTFTYRIGVNAINTGIAYVTSPSATELAQLAALLV
jgi:hypothetical protein